MTPGRWVSIKTLARDRAKDVPSNKSGKLEGENGHDRDVRGACGTGRADDRTSSPSDSTRPRQSVTARGLLAKVSHLEIVVEFIEVQVSPVEFDLAALEVGGFGSE